VDSVIVFDMDGVLAEVTESYREAIVQTVEHFTGQRIARESIQDYKNRGGWNNDWALSQKIASDLGVQVDYDTVVKQFNIFFLGENGDGLVMRERWLPEAGLLERLGKQYALSIFTGRLRYEADITLRRFANGVRFDPIICADDVTTSKPACLALVGRVVALTVVAHGVQEQSECLTDAQLTPDRETAPSLRRSAVA
jgi:HAD superfamily phosphatase